VLRALAVSTTIAALASAYAVNGTVARADPHPLETEYAIGKCVNEVQPAQQQPATFDYNCDRSGVLRDMVWTSWGPDGANGTGKDDSLQCQPNCAQGTRLSNPVVVHAWNPLPPNNTNCPAGFKFYADLTIAYPKGAPPWIQPGTTWDTGTDYVTVDGMPAVHFSKLQPNCLPY
jgi:hypothetical protein